MRRSVLPAVVLGLVALPATTLARDAREITVVNATGATIQSLFVSPVGTEEWEEDVLGVDVLEDGDSVDISFSGYEADECAFDILAANADGDAWLLSDVNLCEVTAVTLTERLIKAQ